MILSFVVHKKMLEGPDSEDFSVASTVAVDVVGLTARSLSLSKFLLHRGKKPSKHLPNTLWICGLWRTCARWKKTNCQLVCISYLYIFWVHPSRQPARNTTYQKKEITRYIEMVGFQFKDFQILTFFLAKKNGNVEMPWKTDGSI